MIVSFVDADGVSWEAWEAHPTLRERRAREERRAATRAVPDRRVRAAPEPSSPGWLVFRSRTGRRRLRMIPDGWHALAQDGLRELLANASRPRGAVGRNS